MKARMMLHSIVIVAASVATASAVVVEQSVTPAYRNEHPQDFSMKGEMPIDGLIHFTVTRHLSEPRYHVVDLSARNGGDVICSSHWPTFVTQRSTTYYFTVSPGYLAESEVEISERAFGGEVGQEHAFLPGGPITHSDCGTLRPP